MADLPRERASVAWRLALANHCVAAGAANEGQSRAPCRLGLRRRAERGRARGGRTLAFRCRVFILDWRFFGTAITIVGNDVRTALRREGGACSAPAPSPGQELQRAQRRRAPTHGGPGDGGVRRGHRDGAQRARRREGARRRAGSEEAEPSQQARNHGGSVSQCSSAQRRNATLRNAKCADLLFASLGCPFICLYLLPKIKSRGLAVLKKKNFARRASLGRL